MMKKMYKEATAIGCTPATQEKCKICTPYDEARETGNFCDGKVKIVSYNRFSFCKKYAHMFTEGHTCKLFTL